MKPILFACTAPLALLATPALAIVGQTSTGITTHAGYDAGDPVYHATESTYTGVVGLLVTYAEYSYTCTGTLLSDRRSVLTAAHCVTDGDDLAKPLSTTIIFDTGSDPTKDIFSSDAPTDTVSIAASAYHVQQDYVGADKDENDIAVVTLSEIAPEWATSYELYETEDLTGKDFTNVGYGLTGVNGDQGSGNSLGTRRKGENRYEYKWSDEDELGTLVDKSGALADNDTYVADFDNGKTANDGVCVAATTLAGLTASDKYCDTGKGKTEVISAPGDSGGPQFVDGKIASITSYGDTFGATGGDTNGDTDMTYGEIDGYVATYLHTDFIKSVMIGAIPEPATWLQMLLGFGLIGGLLRSGRRGAVQPIVARCLP